MNVEARVIGRSERAFRDAFERLKQNKPVRLLRGVDVNNKTVAMEAGLDPSALKRERFPELVAEIRQWRQEHKSGSALSARQLGLAKRDANRDSRGRMAAFKVERDAALSLLLEAEACIVDLTAEILRLKATMPPSNVRPIRGR